ncbi:serine/threonine-protein kinase [Nonomuraea wenchangensis]|uniref:serine/threonine-protein kinase n=1 Tax=Nonomuraea wenchangensis TaxID=568860 RepID=UPI0033265621
MLGAGTTLNDRYVLAGRLGGGGMGEVWRAEDNVLGRSVAVKVMTPALTENATFAQRFQNEARAMATLTHPGVVDVYDYGTCEISGRQVTFLVMEHVRGESLDRVLRRGPLDPAAAMRLVAEVGDALAAAHAQGIVHRDVKPANLMVREGGGVALTDFGIAHSVSAGHLTATGQMLCSAGYCAPEMATSSEVTPAVDVYALGVVAYECLTGKPPFQGETPVQIIFKHLNSPVPELPGEVPAGPRAVVTRALQKTPEQRWESAAAMAAAARQALSAPGVAPHGAGDTGPTAAPGTGVAGTVATGPSTGPVTGSAGGPAGFPGVGGTASGALPGAADATAAGTAAGTLPARPERRGRRTARVALTVAAAVLVSAGVAGAVWLRPDQSSGEATVAPTSVADTTATAGPKTPPTSRQQNVPPVRQSPTAVPTKGVTPRPTPSVTVTPTAPVTQTPTAAPTTPEPSKEPTKEPTPEPTQPGPEPPATEPPSDPPGDIQCVREPCP